ncbi:unnamed protein product [Schistocephalus solidus]|uniref:GCV_T domain-containing protein n=1 Tax=Schistocephalus solidus TaxID=70667 RepID=A0A183TBA9_SCHSO|nr:unnamed protein product [Schistocephalus solidus]
MLFAGADLADLKAVFRPELSEMDVLLTTKLSVFQTRFLKNLDTKFGDLFPFFWDCLSARWLGLKQPCKFATLTAFGEYNLWGFSCHRVPAEVPSDVIALAADIPTQLKMHRLWSADFVDLVSLGHLNHEGAGRPGKPVTEVEVVEPITQWCFP